MQKTHQSISGIMRASVEGQIDALNKLAKRINGEFSEALELLAECRGRTIVFGMKQSGLVGQKIAASLYATGLPTHILDAADTWQENLSMVGPGDVIVMLSYSGKTEALLRLYPSIRQMGNKVIAITGDPKGPVALKADIVLDASVEEAPEIMAQEQAPTTYTTVLLAIGDALAEALLKRRQASSPEAQSSDQKMLWVRDLMSTKDIATVAPTSTLREVMQTMTRYRTNICLVKDSSRLNGIITDGDLRRNLTGTENIADITATNIMNPSPACIQEKTSAEEALSIMVKKKFHTLVVKDKDQNVVGLLSIDKLTYSHA